MYKALTAHCLRTLSHTTKSSSHTESLYCLDKNSGLIKGKNRQVKPVFFFMSCAEGSEKKKRDVHSSLALCATHCTGFL